ncbi:MAG: transketolase C-terminal domain-containing protein [Candidatus Heimdallarchaeaceae archaeon]|nr:MAG: pyruvate ferredoxin oxidoreductase [Candidatus Pacearchaeota archaeon]
MAEEVVMLTGNHSVSEAVKRVKPDVIAAYPITPQTAIIEYLSRLVDSGEIDSHFLRVESEHSALAAVAGASWAGARTFTATSSQGLLYMGEWVFWTGYARLPVVMAVVNRCLAPGWSIWVDLQDSMAFRDAAWIQIYNKNNQEVFDTTIQSYRIAESKDIALPVMPCLDGFVLSHTSSKVILSDPEEVYNFVGDYSDPIIEIDTGKPFAYGSIVMPDKYNKDRKDLMEAMERAKAKIKAVNKEFSETFGRSYGNGLVEKYGDDDADLTIVGIGTMADETQQAIDMLTSEGLKVNSVRVRTFRPFPTEDIIDIAKKNHKLLVIDRSVSFGHEGHLQMEIESVLKRNNIDTPVIGKVMGLGGEDVPYTRIAKVARENL